mgnify:CR=1 FL=1
MGTAPNVLVRLHYYEPGSQGRDFYSSSKKDDYVGYIDKGVRQTERKEEKPSDYLGYADSHEKSSGVFNANGPISDAEKKELRKRLRDTESTIWDCVISFEERYGKENCDTPEKARKLLKKVLPSFFKSIDLNPERTTWYAGLHQNTDNRHIHLSFFQDEPNHYDRKTKSMRFRRGKIQIAKINDLKIAIERNYMEPVQGAERLRRLLVEQSRETVTGLYGRDLDATGRLCQELFDEIPRTGSLSYSSSNMDGVRDKVDSVTELILETSYVRKPYREFLSRVEKKDRIMKEACRMQKVDPKPYLYAGKFKQDMKRRMGNAVIQEIVKLRNEADQKMAELHNAKAQQRVRQSTLMGIMEIVYRWSVRMGEIAYDEYLKQKETEALWAKARYEVAKEKADEEAER